MARQFRRAKDNPDYLDTLKVSSIYYKLILHVMSATTYDPLK